MLEANLVIVKYQCHTAYTASIGRLDGIFPVHCGDGQNLILGELIRCEETKMLFI